MLSRGRRRGEAPHHHRIKVVGGVGGVFFVLGGVFVLDFASAFLRFFAGKDL